MTECSLGSSPITTEKENSHCIHDTVWFISTTRGLDETSSREPTTF